VKRPVEISCGLWSINRWLRWTGFRLFVVADMKDELPTTIGFRFYGWRMVFAELGW
jgi:hypothetical protein